MSVDLHSGDRMYRRSRNHHLVPTARLLAASLPWLVAVVPTAVGARKPKTPVVPSTPSIDDVVSAEGFTPTPSQSEIYRPGTVLVPNDRGGHDVVVDNCVEVEPAVSIMSQSSIATTLSGGVTARLAVAKGSVSAGIEKRLSFVDPEQRTISLGVLNATDTCTLQVTNAARFQDLSDAVVVHDVLVAVVKNTVCTRADASGAMIAIGAAEAAAFSECVQESDGQVPLGYKAVPLKLLVGGQTVASKPPPAMAGGTNAPAVVQSGVAFGSTGDLGVEAKLRRQACEDDARARGEARRASRLDAAERDLQATAGAAWNDVERQVGECASLDAGERAPCVEAVNAWLATAREMPLHLPAGEETVETECGPISAAFAAMDRTTQASDLRTAVALLRSLESTRTEAPSRGAHASVAVNDDLRRTFQRLIEPSGYPTGDQLFNDSLAVFASSPSMVVIAANSLQRKKWKREEWSTRICEEAALESESTFNAASLSAKELASRARRLASTAPAEVKDHGLKPTEILNALTQVGHLIRIIEAAAKADKSTAKAICAK